MATQRSKLHTHTHTSQIKKLFISIKMSNHTPNQVKMNATEDNVIKDTMTVFRLKRKNNTIKDKIIRDKRT